MIAASALLLLASVSAFADIVEWHDAQGIRHFTNIIEDVPAEFRGDTRVVARERGDTSPSTPMQASDAAPRQAQVVYDPAHLAQLYEEGVAQGLREARAGERASRPVQVIAPIAIASLPALPTYPSYVPPSCAWPFVSSGFDLGRSRYRTLRLSEERCRWPRTYFPGVGAFDPRFLPLRTITLPRR